MAMRLNDRAYEHARKLIADGHAVRDERDGWSEHRPGAREENDFIAEHGWDAYARWYLGVDDAHGEHTKGRYAFPYGDFTDVHRCGILSAESRAAQNDHQDIQVAVAHLHGMLDAARSG